MRLHRLTVSAFGPFADTETIDFEELNDAGLFLLTGPTGAGKSSLLDAVCFALYGSVPGVRGVKTLKSQHAPVERQPEVVLDFTVRDRRFVVRRSPEWSRPKRRGDGLVTEKARASIMETTGGVEHFLSSRAAEVGLLVTDLMGMNAGQFVQVALLPQGEFQTFLRASSQERHDVLQHLFRTDRFARIEEWVHEHSRDLRLRSGRDRSTVQRLLDSVADRMALTTPQDLCGDLLPQATTDGRVLGWAEEQASIAVASVRDEVTRHAGAEATLRHCVTRHEAAVLRAEQSTRLAVARAVLLELEETADEAERDHRRLDAGERAAACAPIIGLLDQAVRTAQETAEARGRALTRLATTLDESVPAALDATALTKLGRTLRSRATRFETLLPREAAGHAAECNLAAARTELTAAETELAETTRRAVEVPAEIADLTLRLDDLGARAGRREALGLTLAAARRRHQAAIRLVAAARDVARLADAHRDARDRSLTAREHHQDVVARRLAEMAAELARNLVDGTPCQVCGSTSHPVPAEPAHDAVDAADQEAAETQVAAAGVALEAAAAGLRDAEHRRDTCALDAEGRSCEEAAAEVRSLTDGLADAEAAADEQVRLEARVTGIRRELADLTGRQSTAAARAAGLQQAVSGLEETVRTVADELAEAGATGAGVQPLADELSRSADLAERTCAVVETAERAAERVEELRRQTDESVTDQGFGSVDEARAARLDPLEVRRLADRAVERARASERAREVLAGTGQDLTSADEDDLLRLATARTDAEEAASESARRVHLAEARAEAVDGLLVRLREAIESWEPLRDRSLRAEGMSQLVRGMGHDNQLQMRLSAYVLATRLDQVVAAANERLGHMRDQRYLLQRTDRAARRGSQAGLGLEVVDQWTGDARDPVTLSGGETFVVSLSLALGLADVVTQEAGGTEIDTLFIDEGFGTLDADTLDDVMDRLDGLRAGGRTVGVVSHVSELRNRIPTQVHVAKGRAGSSITVATMVG
jgi:exonuclease SbcC